jgi:hypothetical protein
MTEQHRVDRPDIGNGKSRPRRFRQSDIRQLIVTGLVEGRICQEAEAAEFDERRRTANQGNARCHAISVCQLLAGRVTR